jgi:hypothetical protein
MITYKVKDQYSRLKEFTLSLPDTFDKTGVIIHNGRNVIKKIDEGEDAFVVKYFKGMYLFNRLAYSFFRKSKAARSFAFSEILNEQGISTPPPVGYMDCYRGGLLTKSYFVSVFWPNKTLEQTLANQEMQRSSDKVLFLQELAAFAWKLHNLGIFHVDFSLGNILVTKIHTHHEFALVDLNRIKFGKVSYKKGLKNFNTLHIAPEDMNILIREYAAMCGQPAKESTDRFWKYHERTWYFRRLKRRIRRYTLSRVERLLNSRLF